MNLTKRTLEKLNSAPVKVQLYNGSFNRASVRVMNNKVEYELSVEDTHDILKQFSCVKEMKATFVIWHTQYSGTHYPVPECLNDLVQKLHEATKMTDEEAFKLYMEMCDAMLTVEREMGFSL